MKNDSGLVTTLNEFAERIDYSLLNTLKADPNSTETGIDYRPRQVFSGHYVPVKPTPIGNPVYISHSATFFNELGLSDSLATTPEFMALFSGDMDKLPSPMRSHGWATGYALSIYGTEYIQQCPFQTGNGYGDGRAISIVEAVLNGQRWEMQLKGAGPTPYCRGADGRAVLRSSVREFLAQEHMHALGVPTSRSLCLFASTSDTVDRPWYLEDSDSVDPEILVSNFVAISTRVAPSFLRVGQLELFGRRARSLEHPNAHQELKAIVQHLIQREYAEDIDSALSFDDQLMQLAIAFRDRLTSLVANWIRVGYCQGNFNSDNCAGGGFTLDYGPFGFCDKFDPVFQPWTGGGRHFSFLNQPVAAEKNYEMFCRAITPLLAESPDKLNYLEQIQDEFATVMDNKMQGMWAAKLGLAEYDHTLVISLLQLMMRTGVDYTIFFRELCELPRDVSHLNQSFYTTLSSDNINAWNDWLNAWHTALSRDNNPVAISAEMKRVNPKYTWREWLVAPAYKQAERGDYSLIHELQAVLNAPYDEQTQDISEKFYQRKPSELFGTGGISHYSCSS